METQTNKFLHRINHAVRHQGLILRHAKSLEEIRAAQDFIESLERTQDYLDPQPRVSGWDCQGEGSRAFRRGCR